jgi:hypothetical protein
LTPSGTQSRFISIESRWYVLTRFGGRPPLEALLREKDESKRFNRNRHQLSALGFLLSILNTSALQAQGRPDLEELHQRLLPLFDLDGLVYTDPDERTGRLVVGVRNRGLETSVRARLGRFGVSSQQVDVVVAEPIAQVSSLTDYGRPLVGGFRRSGGTIIFARLDSMPSRKGVQGFVVNSHCTSKQGGVTGTKYYQPVNQTTAEFIGTEIADPSYQRGAGCPHGKRVPPQR